ncbi:MAG: hypothetical protein ABL949_02790 [Fimbriimonadaceae bacterium]
MAFCNWCQLESQGDDVCEWCKRPVARFKYSGFDFIREVEPSGDKVIPIVASVVLICFLALIGYAALSKPAPAATAKLEPIGTLTGSAPGSGGPSAAAVTALKAASSPTAPPTAEPPVYRPPVVRPAENSSRPGALSTTTQAWDDTVISPLKLEKASLKIARDGDGSLVCFGTLTVTLISNTELTNVKIVMNSDNGPIVFRAFTGPAEQPNEHEIVSLLPGLTELRVIAQDVDRNSLEARLKKITVTGRIDSETVSGSVALGN